jgi:hypothetical protein
MNDEEPRRRPMSMRKIAGFVLIALGLLALAFGGFSFTEESHDVEIGSLELGVKEKQRLDIPRWAGIAAVLAGLALLLVGRGSGSA